MISKEYSEAEDKTYFLNTQEKENVYYYKAFTKDGKQ